VSGATPSITQFNPRHIPWQYHLIKNIRKNWSYDKGPHEILLSGSVGSAKSIVMAHLAVTHCMMYKNARFLLGRKSLPSLKRTLVQKVLEHCRPDLKPGRDYTYNRTNANFQFRNGAEILSLSWGDKDYEKFRSVELSAAAIEEVTENDNGEVIDKAHPFYTELVARIGRINADNAGVMENFIIGATNPDDPSHWAYDYFIKGSQNNPRRHVVYSLTKDNPFLPDWYIESLMEKYDRKMIDRLLKGKWVYISSDVIYYEYDPKRHYGFNTEIDKRYPLRITFDFNIAKGKPMSSCLFQFIPRDGNGKEVNKFVFHDEVVIEGSRTLDQMDEWTALGYFDLTHNPKIIIHGDATGRHNDTRSNPSDYDIIENHLANYKRKNETPLEYEIAVPESNPSIRDRHNIVNGQLCNAKGKVSIEVDRKCKTIDEGFSKTKLKDKGQYIEDDSKYYQHITTAIGYGIYDVIENPEINEPITFR